MSKLFAPITWFGRVLLWLLFWPIGLWRSISHGRRKSEQRQQKALRDELARDREERKKAGIS